MVEPRRLVFQFDLDCSCVLRVDEHLMTVLGLRERELRQDLERVAAAHVCEIELYQHDTERARSMRREAIHRRIADRRSASPLRYMGVDIYHQILGTFRVDPLPRPERAVLPDGSGRSPSEVEAATRASLGGDVLLRGWVARAAVGFQPPPAPAKAPEKKPEEQRPDRFALIELD